MLCRNGWIRSCKIFGNGMAFSTKQYRARSFRGSCVAGWITFAIYMCVSSDRKPAKHADERSYPGGTCVSLLTASVWPTPTNVAVRSEIVCLFWPQLLTCARSGWVVNMLFEWLLWHLWRHRPSSSQPSTIWFACGCVVKTGSFPVSLGILCVSSDRKCSHRVEQVVPHCWSERVWQKHGRQKKSVVWSLWRKGRTEAR